MENSDSHSKHLNKVTFGGLLIALGIVFGDIGTSPLYTFAAIVGERTIDPVLVLGGFPPFLNVWKISMYFLIN